MIAATCTTLGEASGFIQINMHIQINLVRHTEEKIAEKRSGWTAADNGYAVTVFKA
jgi:hypothetical protein